MVRKRKAEVACRFYVKYGSCNDPHCLMEHQDKEPRREYHGWHVSWGQKGEGLQKVEFEATEPHVYRFVQESSSVNSSSDENLRTPVQQSRVEELQELEGADEFDVADWTRVLPALPKIFLKRPQELCDLPIVYTLGEDPWDRSVAAKEFITGLADDVFVSHEYRSYFTKLSNQLILECSNAESCASGTSAIYNRMMTVLSNICITTVQAEAPSRFLKKMLVSKSPEDYASKSPEDYASIDGTESLTSGWSFANCGLNPEQEAAAIACLTRVCTLVCGPHDTGKTTLLREVARQLIKHTRPNFTGNFSQIGANGQSNRAVDNIA